MGKLEDISGYDYIHKLSKTSVDEIANFHVIEFSDTYSMFIKNNEHLFDKVDYLLNGGVERVSQYSKMKQINPFYQSYAVYVYHRVAISHNV